MALSSKVIIVLSTRRAGSTLVSAVIGSHPDVCYLPELHMYARPKTDGVYLTGTIISKVCEKLKIEGLPTTQREMYKKALIASRKKMVVEGCPTYGVVVRKIHGMLPKAKYIWAIRHPCDIYWANRKLKHTHDETIRHILKISSAIGDFAKDNGRILQVKYEELTGNTDNTIRKICRFLKLKPKIKRMKKYGTTIDDEYYKPGFGDWTSRIKSGKITKAVVYGKKIPNELIKLAKEWGYES